MANKRMIRKDVIDTDAFLDMPLSTQALYFHLNLRADDDGFVGNPSRIAKFIGASDDDLKLLIAKNFVILFENGVIVIKHWRMHNTLSANRYHETNFTDEKSMLRLKENNSYTLGNGHKIDDSHLIEMSNRQQTNNRQTLDEQKTNSDIDKDIDIDLDKDIDISYAHFQEFWNVYPRKLNKKRAYKCYQARINEGYSEQDLLTAAQNYSDECRKEKRDSKFIKHPTTFLSVDTPFTDYLPHGISGKPNMKVEWGKMIRDLSEQEHAPYFGFPPEWFDGDKLIQERVESVICPKGTMPGIYEDYEMSVKELLETYEARRRYANGDTIDFFEYPECTSDS